MSYAKLRTLVQTRATVLFALGVVLIIAVSLAVHGLMFKRIVLVVDGEERVVTTRHSDYQKLLEEQGVAFDAHDRIAKPGRGRLADGDRGAHVPAEVDVLERH